ncbi:MAG: hypothetical protein MUC51_15640 [Anaerolineae bacterium]|nr:hypothetical protein [Anaerolineae bacterium]
MDTQLALYQAPAVEVLDPEPPVNPNDMMAAFMHALVAAAPPKLTEEEKERAWAEAYDKWLAETPKTGAPRPAATARSYQAAWTDFKIFCPKKYWRVTGLDVREWVDDLRTRVIDPNTEKGLIANGRRQPGQLRRATAAGRTVERRGLSGSRSARRVPGRHPLGEDAARAGQ